MQFFLNKFFWLGILSLLVLVGIPLTVYYVKQQQDLQSQAKPTTVVAFEPATKTASIGQDFNIDIVLTPNENAVTFVKLKLLFDPTKVNIQAILPNTTKFPLVLETPKITTGSATMTLGIGAQPLNAIQAKTTVATVTVRPLSATTAPTILSFDPSQTQILSLADADEPAENVLSQTTPASITISSSGSIAPPTPTINPGIPTPTTTATGAATPTPTRIPRSTNILPVCTTLTLNPPSPGAVPFSTTLSATGSDTDGLITKVTFTFGDGQVQDVPEEDNIEETITSQITHTYQTAGTFIASAVFTDDEGGISTACSQSVTVSQATPTPTPAPVVTATLAPTGAVSTTIGIIGAILLAIIGGIILFAL